ncbi:MAG: biotin/lipoyl-binding protein [Opitutus sp.]
MNPDTIHRPSFARRRFALAGLSAVVLAGSAVLLFRPASAQAEKPSAPVAPPATKVTVAPVEEKMVTEYEEITGRIDAKETVELRARVSGHLESVHFQAGELVKKGDVLFTIDPALVPGAVRPRHRPRPGRRTRGEARRRIARRLRHLERGS